jgi:hypothetical protein
MATILPALRERDSLFDPKDITAMSVALDDVCKEFHLRDDSAAREVIAVRIIDLAKAGQRSPGGSATECCTRPVWQDVSAWTRTPPATKDVQETPWQINPQR